MQANYGHTSSQATFPIGGRPDHPTLLSTAPNNWNVEGTYDKKGISARMGLTHNDANLWSHGGDHSKTPSGDKYLYPHAQVQREYYSRTISAGLRWTSFGRESKENGTLSP